MEFRIMNYEINRGTVIFDGINSQDYGVWIKGSGVYNAPARRYSSITIPGRNGTLTIDEGVFEEVEHNYPAFIPENFTVNIRAFRNALLSRAGYKRMTDSYHPDEYYRAKFMDGLEVTPAPRAIGGEFELRFRRDPRRFLVCGDITQTVINGGYIENPTAFPSKPLIRVTGYGQLYVGADRIDISQQYAYVDIDCEMMDCYHGTDNANPYVSFQYNDFPTLGPGRTGITYSGNITKIEITPHWWRI